jgi:putative colanic acid biosynthesis UDP-glucose lipid carrier transferase
VTNRYNRIFHPLFIVVDLVGIIFAFWVAYYLKYGKFTFEHHYLTLLVSSLLFYVLLSLCYVLTKEPRTTQEMTLAVKRFLSAQLVFWFILTGFVVFTRFTDISRQFFGTFLFLQFTVLAVWRYGRKSIMQNLRATGYNNRFLSLIGSEVESKKLEQWVASNPELGFVYVNNFPFVQDEGFQDVSWSSVFGSRDTNGLPDHVLISDLCPSNVKKTVVEVAEDNGARVHLIQQVPKVLAQRTKLELFGPFSVESIRSEPLSIKRNRFIKRGFDMVFSLFVLVGFFSWFYVIAGLLIKLTSKGSVLIRQRRPGRNSSEFLCFKFRTMINDPNSEQGEGEITKVNDSRITLIGRLLRITNLDELPQFLNVLIGDMSVVGPRPLPIKEDREVRQVLKRYPLRQFIKPGITGHAAINGYRGSTPDMELMQKRIDLDILYVENWSFWFDLKICCITVWQMLSFRTGAH